MIQPFHQLLGPLSSKNHRRNRSEIIFFFFDAQTKGEKISYLLDILKYHDCANLEIPVPFHC